MLAIFENFPNFIFRCSVFCSLIPGHNTSYSGSTKDWITAPAQSWPLPAKLSPAHLQRQEWHGTSQQAQNIRNEKCPSFKGKKREIQGEMGAESASTT